ncbi:siderophore-iron reductase FhuF [Acetobacteraceae bacterium H6797]|nr:siderophore-iron reductase FhuF [Acetobacteraceae bacterium H6797]
MTLPVLQPLLGGPLGPYARRLLAPDTTGEAPPGTRLLEPETLRALLARFGTRYGDAPDIRGCASLWFKHHLAAWLVGGLAVNLLLDHELPLSLEDIAIRMAAGGETEAVHLPGNGKRLEELDANQRFAVLTEGHLAPLIGVLAKVSRASPRLFWSNAGNLFENVLCQIEQAMPGAPGLTAARAFLAVRDLSSGRPNPLFAPIRYIEQDGRRIRKRKVCCLRYLLPGLNLCSTCPLPSLPRISAP